MVYAADYKWVLESVVTRREQENVCLPMKLYTVLWGQDDPRIDELQSPPQILDFSALENLIRYTITYRSQHGK